MMYCGSKLWQRKLIDELLPEDTTLLVSPFFGSGKVEYFLAERRPKMAVKGRDTFQEAVEIHRCAQVCHASFERAIREAPLPNSAEELQEQFAKMKASENEFERAVLAYVILHCSYNGRFGSFRKRAVGPKRLALKSRDNLYIEHGDGMDWIAKWPGEKAVIYADPPYIVKHKEHYATGREAHTPEFHKTLAQRLQTCGTPFILSINDCPQSRLLYSECLFKDPGRKGELLVLGPMWFWEPTLQRVWTGLP